MDWIFEINDSARASLSSRVITIEKINVVLFNTFLLGFFSFSIFFSFLADWVGRCVASQLHGNYEWIQSKAYLFLNNFFLFFYQ